MAEPKPGDFVFSYQKFDHEDGQEPSIPFLCHIVADKIRLWLVEYRRCDGTIVKRRINKGCCSSKPLNPDEVDFTKTKIKLPVRIKL